MGATFKFFRFFIFIAALLSLSCATRLEPPEGPSSLNESSSVVFGKLEVKINEKLVDKKTSIVWPVMICYVRPYISNVAIRTNHSPGGWYQFKVPINTKGYFSFVIPPGKYYFSRFSYLSLISAYPNFDVDTRAFKQPYCLTFDVPANRAVYIGTILSDFHASANNDFYFKGDLAFEVINDFAGAKEWFFQSNPGFGTNVVEREVNMTPL